MLRDTTLTLTSCLQQFIAGFAGMLTGGQQDRPFLWEMLNKWKAELDHRKIRLAAAAVSLVWNLGYREKWDYIDDVFTEWINDTQVTLHMVLCPLSKVQA